MDIDSALKQEITKRASDVQALLSQKKTSEAISLSLQSPPVLTKDESLKEQNFKTVISALLALSSKTDITKFVSTLSLTDQDTLMKYIYKGLGCSSNSSAASALLLEWHSQLVSTAGDGCIVRALADRKTV